MVRSLHRALWHHVRRRADLAAQVGREVAAAELVRRPPQRLDGDGGVVACLAADVGAQEARRVPGQQDSAQDRPERLRIDVGADRGRDRLSDGIGLLG
jgi:hypothetical protein